MKLIDYILNHPTFVLISSHIENKIAFLFVCLICILYGLYKGYSYSSSIIFWSKSKHNELLREYRISSTARLVWDILYVKNGINVIPLKNDDFFVAEVWISKTRLNNGTLLKDLQSTLKRALVTEEILQVSATREGDIICDNPKIILKTFTKAEELPFYDTAPVVTLDPGEWSIVLPIASLVHIIIGFFVTSVWWIIVTTFASWLAMHFFNFTF